MPMKALVQQTISGSDGNCHEACVASLLGLPLEGVPRLYGKDTTPEFQAWIRSQGYHYVYIVYKAQRGDHLFPCPDLSDQNPLFQGRPEWATPLLYGNIDGYEHVVVGVLHPPLLALGWDPHTSFKGVTSIRIMAWLIPTSALPSFWQGFPTVELYLPGDPRRNPTPAVTSPAMEAE